MVNIVSITSQGQVTIPAKIRKHLGLKRYEKALVRIEKGKMIIEPIPDLLNLGGSLKQKALRGKNIAEIIKLEEETVAKASMRRSK